MFKKTTITIGAIIILMIASIMVFHNQWTDRINPTIPETISYAKVPKGQQTYSQVKVIDASTGKKLPYKLKKIKGYLPDKQYISIDHKGQYVKEIKYISKRQFDRVSR